VFITIKTLKEHFEDAVEALKTLRESEGHVAGYIAGETAEDIYSDNAYHARLEKYAKDNSQAIMRAISDAASLDDEGARSAVLEKLIEDIEPQAVVWSHKRRAAGAAKSFRGNSDALMTARNVAGCKDSFHPLDL
jgi:DNA-binding LacI/PurR family transcriptional regulator